MTEDQVLPRRFWLVGALLLVWALLGDASYLAQVTRAAPMDAETARLFDAMPAWLWAVFAVAVWSGTAGAIALLLRRRVAVPLYALSLAAVVVQFGYVFAATETVAVQGLVHAVSAPIVIALVGAFQLWWARRCAARGLLR